MDATTHRTHTDRARKSLAGRCLFSSALFLLVLNTATAHAANFRTRNFLVEAPTSELAREVGEQAEKFRHELATYWTGSALPPWPTPCPIRVIAGDNLAAQGVTTYNPAPVRDFQMEVIGTPERILDSVLPHEVTHTVLATHFGRPLPRWADEGICTTVEHASERAKHEAKLREFLASRRGIAMNRLFLLTEYPQDVLPMYAQGYSVCRFLIEQQGPQTFIGFLEDYMQRPSWTANVQKHYGYDSLAELQEYWLKWVEAGSGPVEQYVKADPRAASAPDASIASRQPGPGSTQQGSGGDMALASASVPSDLSQESLHDEATSSMVAANDRGRLAESDSEGGWYHRRAAGQSGAKSTDASASGQMGVTSTPMPPSGQVADTAGMRASSTNRTQDPATPLWAPPSVISSGRYSAATPQAETMGSMRPNTGVLDSRRDQGRGTGPNGGVWR
ncbi:hypothetical protein [Allorhodopirellula solitaria]|uniref:Peptidase MA-like domain-containing protein n=1 Tax=Allorhodopirellula solitaria TaxID=2527987 RepID=A0A5C5YJF7_9BACT|nr:hypothetical protein [Allorhodopirellula solitaria]TWT75010.1 hypothetical protein CA85_02980 [Allorhodopirellula solitaria]